MTTRLRRSDFDSFLSEAPDAPCVYILFRDGEVAYVGQTRTAARRLYWHRHKGRVFDDAVFVCIEHDDIDWLEAALISYLEPPENKDMATRDLSFFDLEVLERYGIPGLDRPTLPEEPEPLVIFGRQDLIEEIRAALAREGLTQRAIARRLSENTGLSVYPNHISAALNSDTGQFDYLREAMASELLGGTWSRDIRFWRE